AADAFKAKGDYLGLARTLEFQGQVDLAQGQTGSAADRFSQAATIYEQGGNPEGAIKARINQAQALRNAGLYRRALNILDDLNASLTEQTNSLLKAIVLRSLGITQRLIGNLDEAQAAIEESLKIADTLPVLQRDENASAANLMLGNIAKDRGNLAKDREETVQAQGYFQEAINFYQITAETATTPTARVEAQLNQLSIVGDAKQPFTDVERELLRQIRTMIEELPLSRTAVSARINWARMAMNPENHTGVNPQDIAQQLSMAIEQARTLKDPRIESYALGQLGELRLQQKQLAQAQENTKQALILAQSIGASDIAYRWQWQLGQILNEQPGNTQGAIAAYEAAVNSLESLRSDLVTVNRNVQFSFRDSVEPVYRQLVGLLLESKDGNVDAKNLEKARTIIESLQQAELVNFFRENCLTAKPIQIDQIDQKAAVIYLIVLDKQLEVVVTLPGGQLKHHTVSLPRETIEETFAQLREAIAPIGSVDPNRSATDEPNGTTPDDPNRASIGVVRTKPGESVQYLPLAQQVYDWLIRPIEPELASSGAKTLVFVVDAPLLNVPMAVLHDGQKYLIEKYAIAQTPGLQLLDPKPLVRGELTVLKAGLTKGRELTINNSTPPLRFGALPNVKRELEAIQSEVSGEVILNEQFTTGALQKAIESVPFPVVHLATHGQFGSDPENTFILTWNGRLDIDQLNQLLRGREEGGTRALELLVLSACQTAAGDKRAALGLAGVAVKAGARSTLATLWVVDDRSTADLMIEFYKQLKENPTISKAEALRQAQLSFIQKGSRFQDPYYWAPFILVGNWL
ncbi:MAG TPA: CHAT domain-containing protein, partial [Cyanophyceae cyanobacterium]